MAASCLNDLLSREKRQTDQCLDHVCPFCWSTAGAAETKVSAKHKRASISGAVMMMPYTRMLAPLRARRYPKGGKEDVGFFSK